MAHRNRWHPRLVHRCFEQRYSVPHTMNDVRISPNQRTQVLAESDKAAESAKRSESNPDDPPPPDDD